ncbi:MAG: transposase [Candidatus Parcubacteria bacterium]|nr:transposase [Candidatus Parcubacteria bacterium]
MKKYNDPGHSHFVTFKTYQDYPFFKDERCCELFLENLNFYRNKFELKIFGYCLLPDHAHLILYFDLDKYPELTISKIMHDIKGRSAQSISKYILSMGSRSFYASVLPPEKQGIKALSTRDCIKIWQPGFYDFNIYTSKKFDEKLKYIHNNPIKHGLTDDISSYKYCSWRNYELGDHSIFKIDYPEY